MKTNSIQKTTHGRPRKGESKIDVLQALKLRLHNRLSYDEIAKRFGVTKTAVYHVLSEFAKITENPEIVEGYASIRGKLLTAGEFELLKEIFDPEKLKKASLNNVAYAFSHDYNANRLERGESTRNVQFQALQMKLEEIRKEKALLIKEFEGMEIEANETESTDEADRG